MGRVVLAAKGAKVEKGVFLPPRTQSSQREGES